MSLEEQIAGSIAEGKKVYDLVVGKFGEWDNSVKNQIKKLEDWRSKFENKMYKTYDIYKEFEKVRIYTQAQVDADDTLSNEAVFTMQGFQDARVLNFVLTVNVEGDGNHSQTTTIDIRRYSIGSSTKHKWDQKVVSNATVDGRNWRDNYRDINIIPSNIYIPYGVGTFKIINTGDKYLEIFAIGIKLQK